MVGSGEAWWAKVWYGKARFDLMRRGKAYLDS